MALMQGCLFVKPAFETVVVPAATMMERRQNTHNASTVVTEIPIEGEPVVFGILADKGLPRG